MTSQERKTLKQSTEASGNFNEPFHSLGGGGGGGGGRLVIPPQRTVSFLTMCILSLIIFLPFNVQLKKTAFPMALSLPEVSMWIFLTHSSLVQ